MFLNRFQYFGSKISFWFKFRHMKEVSSMPSECHYTRHLILLYIYSSFLLVDVCNYFLLQKTFFLIQKQVIVIVLLLFSQFKSSILILGMPGICEKDGLFQCDNGRCIYNHYICNGIDICGDNSDESFCGMCAWFFCVFNTNI